MSVNELISIVDRCYNPVELRVAVNWLIRAYSHYHSGEFSCRDEPRAEVRIEFSFDVSTRAVWSTCLDVCRSSRVECGGSCGLRQKFCS